MIGSVLYVIDLAIGKPFEKAISRFAEHRGVYIKFRDTIGPFQKKLVESFDEGPRGKSRISVTVPDDYFSEAL